MPISASRRPSTDWKRLPSVTRTIEAASTGTATRKADSVGDSAICLEINGANGPNITHTVKPVSKYRKQAINAFQLPLCSDASSLFMRSSSLVPPHRPRTVRSKKKRCDSRGVLKQILEVLHQRREVGSVARRTRCWVRAYQTRMQRLCHGNANGLSVLDNQPLTR